jgi:hypothetical protein
MTLPQFNAKASLGPVAGFYSVLSNSTGNAVLPMLAKQCTNCEVVGRFPGIGGAGFRSCCQPVLSCVPAPCHVVENCWIESCLPQPIGSFP